jgi:hypothetical protein
VAQSPPLVVGMGDVDVVDVGGVDVGTGQDVVGIHAGSAVLSLLGGDSNIKPLSQTHEGTQRAAHGG